MSYTDERYELVDIADRPGALEGKLLQLKRSGRRVLDFWRNGRRWTFKLMVGVRAKVERGE